MLQGNKRFFPQKVALAIFVLFMLMLSLTVTRVSAHKVNVFAWVEGDTVFVEGYYSGNKKARNSLVEVFNKAGVKLLEGRTNEKGEFSFNPSEKTELRIVLTAGTGHKNDFVIPASHFGEVDSPSSGLPAEPQEDRTYPATLTTEPRQLEEMIDRALDRKLAPVLRLIRETRREGPTFSEIVGGIGYIFGLFGVAIYFSNRKKKERGQRSAVSGQQNADID
jgi:nickel transport protein